MPDIKTKKTAAAPKTKGRTTIPKMPNRMLNQRRKEKQAEQTDRQSETKKPVSAAIERVETAGYGGTRMAITGTKQAVQKITQKKEKKSGNHPDDSGKEKTPPEQEAADVGRVAFAREKRAEKERQNDTRNERQETSAEEAKEASSPWRQGAAGGRFRSSRPLKKESYSAKEEQRPSTAPKTEAPTPKSHAPVTKVGRPGQKEAGIGRFDPQQTARQQFLHDAKKEAAQGTRTAKRAAKDLGQAVGDAARETAEAAKELISRLTIGGGIAALAVILMIAATAAVFVSPLGILFADEAHEEGSIPLASAISQISAEYMAKLESLQNGNYQSVQIHGKPPKWKDVVAVFATKTAGTNDGVDVLTLDEDRVERMRQVFWDMTKLTTKVETTTYTDQQGKTVSYQILHIYIEAKTADEMRSEYSFTNYQNEALDFLLENLDDLDIPMGDLEISQEDAIVVLSGLPDDLSPERQAVLEAALSLVGKVTYFWGGKSQTIGWDDRWGTPTTVTAAGSGTTGTVRPLGLDCSGFVDWAFFNASEGTYLPGRGGGAATQHSYCTDIPMSEAQPGDLVFYADDSHVGIVGGYDADGNLLIIHCSGTQNGVAITGSAGFTQAARPDCF